ncbi:MAG: ABC transporter substrate-binding protein, partial [Pseudomonadota bacterium]
MKTTSLKYRRRTFAKAALAGIAWPLTSSFANAENVIKLGSVMDKSGVFEAYGGPMDKAEKLAIAQINAAGGLNGQK